MSQRKNVCQAARMKPGTWNSLVLCEGLLLYQDSPCPQIPRDWTSSGLLAAGAGQEPELTPLIFSKMGLTEELRGLQHHWKVRDELLGRSPRTTQGQPR